MNVFIQMGKRDQVLAAFGRNLRKHRERTRLTQETLAEKAEMDRTYVSDIERGKRNPGIKNFASLDQTLGIASAKLTEGNDK